MLWHFVLTRWFSPVLDREELDTIQRRKLQRFLQTVIKESPCYRDLAPALESFPVMKKATFLARFVDLNRFHIPLETATQVALRAEQERDFKPELPGGLTVGLSSGTSGARHVFLVSRADRCRWAGQMLARMLTTESLQQVLNPFAASLRIAFFLRASSNLYTTLSGWRVRLDYYDLTRSFASLIEDLTAQQPHVLVAPATVLAELARAKVAIRPTQIISVAEVLDERDRRLIESVFGVRVAEVYQAAEGFLGCTCEHGRIHLNEDALHIEPRWMDEKCDRFQPVITDFSRNTQWFVRYQLDDILRLNKTPCPCGSATMSLHQIEGRTGEVLWLKSERGRLTPVFPDSLRQAIYTMPSPPELYRVEQHGDRWEIRLRNGDSGAVRAALEKLITGMELVLPTIEFLPWTDQAPAEKQKRIRCVTKPA